MRSERLSRILFSLSAVLFAGSLISYINAPSAALESTALAGGPFDAAGQRGAMLEELRAIKELMTEAETRAKKAEEDRQDFEKQFTKQFDRRYYELVRLLKSGDIKLGTAAETTTTAEVSTK